MTKQELQKIIQEKNWYSELSTLNDIYFENQYVKSLIHILNNGKKSGDRTGTGTIRLDDGYRFVFTNDNIPLLRGKLVNPWNALTELIWILLGKNDLNWLKNNGVNYWDEWVLSDGTFGPIYGVQMRNQDGFDQFVSVINKLRDSPETRQAYISLWNAKETKNMGLPPCHLAYHPLIVDGYLNLHCGQRSADSFLGVPYDYMLFWFMQQILAYWTDTKPGKIIHTNNDYHIYQNHYSAIYQYFENYFDNPSKKFIDSDEQKIFIDLKFPKKDAYFLEGQKITSEIMNRWLEDFYLNNKYFLSNYSDKQNRYGLIKANVAI